MTNEKSEIEIRKENEFKTSVLNAMKDQKEMPAESTTSNAKREMKMKTLKLFAVAKVGTFITRTDLGKLIGFDLPVGTWRKGFGEKIDNKNLIDFNYVKNRLIDSELISERTQKFQRGKSEYRFTLLRPVIAEDVE
ncbi:MAG: hypothetical protein KAR20_20385 [Candidatus Heimdallarchaeota archaeon]|nr:hypothetical protein [Candidatus Heimdallarchaeota archaeon]